MFPRTTSTWPNTLAEHPPIEWLLKDERFAQGLARLDYFVRDGLLAIILGQNRPGKILPPAPVYPGAGQKPLPAALSSSQPISQCPRTVAAHRHRPGRRTKMGKRPPLRTDPRTRPKGRRPNPPHPRRSPPHRPRRTHRPATPPQFRPRRRTPAQEILLADRNLSRLCSRRAAQADFRQPESP